MTPEKLTKINDLKKRIEDLKEHRDTVNRVMKAEKDYSPALDFVRDRAEIRIREKYSVLPVVKFIELYLLNIDKEIADMQKEFESL